jgi:hypothetical protein
MGDVSMLGRVKIFLKDPDRKGFLQILKEVVVLTVTKKEIPFYYFKFVYKKKVNNYLDYTGLNEQKIISSSKTLHKPEHFSLINNKLFFSLFCENINLRSPKLISYNFGSVFFFDGTPQQIQTKEELINFFETVFTTTNSDALFLRPPANQGGRGCFKLTKSQLYEKVEERFETLMKDSYVHTEVVEQHEAISKIHGSSINTLRIISLITADKTTEIIVALLRFGVGTSVVDNASSGGFFVGVNMEDGTLKASGDYFQEHGGKEVFEHPDSGVKFKDFKVPFFKEACELVKEGVKVIPDRFIGWDVAITPTGPTIIEANSIVHIPCANMGLGGLLKNEHIRDMFKELKNN